MNLKKLWRKNKTLNLKYLGIKVKTALAVTLTLVILSLVISFNSDILAAFRLVFGTVFSLFIPGFFVSHIFFEADSKSIDSLERLALSFALSISVVPLIIFYLNLIGIKITTLNSVLTIIGVILISVGIIELKRRRKSSKK